ncbi:MAG TPA: hypothetical protein VLD17_07225 [Gemmatimonadaceae bacterium]|nr:hypothetical protein [Gemmatimonadaceae bacterium]
MLSLQELASISRELRDQHVLSVYVDAAFDDPALRTAWRPQADHAIKAIRRRLEAAPHAERTNFERCVTFLDSELSAFAGGIGAPGWFAFITADGVRAAEKIPAPMPTLALWMIGPCIAPYIRVLKQERPVVVIVAGASQARLYRYITGVLEPAHSIHAHATVEEPAHMGDTPRLGFHAGTRGSTGRDAAQLAHHVGTERMIHEATRESLKIAGRHGWIVVGGIPEVGAHITRALEPLAPDRVIHLEGVEVHATDAGVREAAERAASRLRDQRDLRQIAEITGAAVDDRWVVRGAVATRRALDSGSVRELYFTPRFLESSLVDAEYSVRAALAQSAEVEEVSRTVAERLDEFGGVGARLRFAAPL